MDALGQRPQTGGRDLEPAPMGGSNTHSQLLPSAKQEVSPRNADSWLPGPHSSLASCLGPGVAVLTCTVIGTMFEFF